ncbi:Uncharacterised protein [Vibrio cholerae]|nr:Uncharacterised protein [Vibrio cholerae]
MDQQDIDLIDSQTLKRVIDRLIDMRRAGVVVINFALRKAIATQFNVAFGHNLDLLAQ